MQQTNNIHNIKLNWAGLGRPNQLGRPQPQRCWADLGPKWIGPTLAQKPNIPFWARKGWARIRLAQQPKQAGGIIFPPPLHAERYSFYMQRRKKINDRIEGKKDYLARRRRWLAVFLAVLWRRRKRAFWVRQLQPLLSVWRLSLLRRWWGRLCGGGTRLLLWGSPGVADGLKGNGAAVIWPGKEADGREQLGWRGTLLLLFSCCWGRMEERPGDGNEGVRGDCSVQERGEWKGDGGMQRRLLWFGKRSWKWGLVTGNRAGKLILCQLWAPRCQPFEHENWSYL